MVTAPEEMDLVIWIEHVRDPVQWTDTGDCHVEHLVLIPILMLCP